MLNKLAPRERQIVDLLYERGELAVSEICELAAGQSQRLGGAGDAQAARGQGLCHRAAIRSAGFVYSPTLPDSVVRKTALSDVVRVFFNGSAAGAASALLGMSDRLDSRRARRARGDDRAGARSQGGTLMEWILSLALKSLIVAGVALLLLRLARNRSAIDRSWIAHLGLAAILLLPLAAVALPRAGSRRPVVPGRGRGRPGRA